MKAIFVNGSPRKGWNTHEMLASALQGAMDAGAETEMIHLADYPVTGCRSCFACKRKDSTCGGICAIRDALRPVYERIMDADVLVIGSPVYFGGLSALTMAFMERLVFPIHQYKRTEDGSHPRILPKAKKLALIATMNCPESIIEGLGYTGRLESAAGILSELLSDEPCPVLCACDTVQFSDYSKYVADAFDADAKKHQRETQFPVDLQKAYALGKNLCS